MMVVLGLSLMQEIFDNELSFEKQINSFVKSCFNVIRKLSKIKGFLPHDNYALQYVHVYSPD